MAFISHLFGLAGPLRSVGAGGENNPADVKIIKALLNTYLRTKGAAVLPISASAEGLSPYIQRFQKEKLNLPTPDGRVDPGGKTLAALLHHLRGCYTVRAVTPPREGRLTWDAEGDEGGRFGACTYPTATLGLRLGADLICAHASLQPCKPTLPTRVSPPQRHTRLAVLLKSGAPTPAVLSWTMTCWIMKSALRYS